MGKIWKDFELVVREAINKKYGRYKYVPFQYTEYQYVLLCHNTPSFSEDGSPYSLMFIRVNYKVI